jgi:hypothetical protein
VNDGRSHDRRGKIGRSRSSLWPRAARQRSRRRSLDQAIEIVEETNLTPEEQKQAAKLRRLPNDLDLPEAD